MKNYSLGLLTAMILLVCCSGSTKSNNHQQPYPKARVIAETQWGIIYKYQDGENTVYVYERGSGGSGISVVTSCSE